MSSLRDQINSELKQAMLDKNVFVRDTLRLVTSEIKRFEVDTRQEPSDDEIISILKRMAKQRKDSINQFKEGGRPDLEEIEQNELNLLDKYLPQALNGEALKTVLEEIILNNNFSGMQDMGNAMKELRSKHPNAEMSEASSIVKTLLS
ncbi:MAG: GatB/YqeY domain-containing protein [SAR86 cluster bacterium]|uniref:GatB/YqeY domain-containing protein n=1 Tax=SAR86 cluster bacterium TaxID=2030880 RepID=A0A520MUI9_9GAMM|nr:glutamyl-tRNA amidotransferase [Gammaproteobacteria bacterium]RZO24868.1 MAG: GatB/YqeY domain-containing protein [SAR86 cluster bacterium]